MLAIEFLRRANNENGRIVSSGDLTLHQIAWFQANNRFFVDEETGLGWALVQWNLTTDKDRAREAIYFGNIGTMPAKEWLARAMAAEDTVHGGNYVSNGGKAIIPAGTAMYYCDRCDGCGWYEGGPTLQTICEKCKGTGLLNMTEG